MKPLPILRFSIFTPFCEVRTYEATCPQDAMLMHYLHQRAQGLRHDIKSITVEGEDGAWSEVDALPSVTISFRHHD